MNNLRWRLVFAAVVLALGAVLVPAAVGGAATRDGPRPLTERGEENLVAFARLYGIVRYFHPTDEVRRADWDRLATEGVRAAEGAPTSDSLARVLAAWLAPVAPAVELRVGNGEWVRAGGAAAAVDDTHGGASEGPVASWVHRGVRHDARASAPYSSLLVRSAAAAAPRLPPDAVELEIGAGLGARVPTALYAGDWSPRGDSLPYDPPMAPGNGDAGTRSTHLAAVVVLWNVFQHFYPYFDVVETDWPRVLRRGLGRAARDSTPEARVRTLEWMLVQTRDGHAGAIPRQTRGVGVPPVAFGRIGDLVVITAKGGSAGGDIRVGDVVRALDGRPTEEVVRERLEVTPSARDAAARDLVAQWLGRGRWGTRATMELDHADGTRDTVRLTRRMAVGEYIALLASTRPDSIAELKPGVWYVDLTRIDDTAFERALPGLARATGIVFDLRGYPSRVFTPAILARLTDDTIRSARFEIPVITRPDRRDVSYADGGWPVAPMLPRLHAHVAFLTDSRAISYAETTMGIVEAFELGAIVGSATAGTNGNIDPLLLPGGYRMYWTAMRVRKHDGSRHHGIGIQPTHPIEPTLDGIRAGRDEVLEAGLAVVTGYIGAPVMTPAWRASDLIFEDR